MSSSIVEALTAPEIGPRPRSWRAALMKSVKGQIAWIRTERQIRRSIDELSALDDRTLADIGLSRWQIPHAVRHVASATPTTKGVRR